MRPDDEGGGRRYGPKRLARLWGTKQRDSEGRVRCRTRQSVIRRTTTIHTQINSLRSLKPPEANNGREGREGACVVLADSFRSWGLVGNLRKTL